MSENVIDTLSLEINSNANGADKAIDKLSASLLKLQNRTSGLQNVKLNGLSGQLKQFNSAVRGLDVGKLGSFSTALRNFSDSIKSFSGVGQRIEPAIKNMEALSKFDFSKLKVTGDYTGMSSLASGIKSFAEVAPKLAEISPKEINRVVSAFEKLGTVNLGQLSASLQSLNGVDTSVLSNLGTAFQGFASAVSGADKVPGTVAKIFSAIGQLASSSGNIPAVTSGLSDISIKIKEFIETLASAPAVQPGTVSIVTALSGIASSGNKAQTAAAALPQITDGVKEFVFAMQKIPALDSGIVRTVQSLAQLSSAGARTGSAAQTLQKKIAGLSSSMKSLEGGTKGAVIGLGSFAKQLLSMAGFGAGVFGFVSAIKKSITEYSNLMEIQNIAEVGFGNMIGKLEQFSQKSITLLGMSEAAAKRTAGTFAAMGKSLGVIPEQATDMSIELTKLSADMASFWNVSQDVARNALTSVFTGETESLKRFSVVLTEANLQQFAYANGINKSIRNMTEAERTQLRYNYIMSATSHIMGDFARTAGGSWANQVRILSEQFRQLAGIVGGVLMAAFLPIIKTINIVISKIVSLATVLSNFLGKLFGFEEITSGSGAGLANIADSAGVLADNMEASAGGLSDAGAAAKKSSRELNKYIAAWHEVNSMSSNDSGDGGGGGAGGGGAFMPDMSLPTKYDFTLKSEDEISPVLDKIKNRFIQLKNLFLKGFRLGLGDTSVFDSITKSLGSIRDSLTEIFTDKKVLSSFNEMLDTLTYAAGIKVGSFVSIGASIVDNILGGVSIYLDSAKERIKEWLINMFDITAQTDTIQANFIKALGDIFTVFRSDSAKELTASIIQIFVYAFLGITELSAKFGRDILNLLLGPITENAQLIKDALLNTITPLGEVIGTVADSFTALWEKVQSVYDEHIQPTLSSFASGISEIVETLLNGYNQHIAPVLDRLAGKFTEVWGKSIHPLITNFIGYFGDMADLIKAVWENVLQPVINWIAQNIMPVVGPVLEAFVSRFLDSFRQVADAFNGFLEASRGVIQFLTGVFSGDWQKAWEGIQNIFKGIWDAMPGYIKGPISSIISLINKMIGGIESGVNSVINAVKNLKIEIPDWVPKIGGNEYNLGKGLSTVSLPRIPQLAKGGIVKRATTILAGEDGAEAIVPLQKNTEWMHTLSSRIADDLSRFSNLELNYDVPKINDYVPERNSYDMSRMQSTLQMALDERAAQEAFEMRQMQETLEKILVEVRNKQLVVGDSDIFNANRRETVKFGNRTKKDPYPVYGKY